MLIKCCIIEIFQINCNIYYVYGQHNIISVINHKNKKNNIMKLCRCPESTSTKPSTTTTTSSTVTPAFRTELYQSYSTEHVLEILQTIIAFIILLVVLFVVLYLVIVVRLF